MLNTRLELRKQPEENSLRYLDENRLSKQESTEKMDRVCPLAYAIGRNPLPTPIFQPSWGCQTVQTYSCHVVFMPQLNPSDWTKLASHPKMAQPCG